MGQRRTSPIVVKIIFVLIFSGLLIYWASAAINKYLNQPVSTFVSYTQGDDDTHVILPHVTFCDENFVISEKVLQACNTQTNAINTKMLGQNTPIGDMNFLSVVSSCLNNGIDFDMNDYLKSLEEVKMNEFIVDHYMTESTFNNSFLIKYDLSYGPCIEFDGRKVDMKVGDPDTDLFLKLNIPSLTSSIKTILHTSFDYPDACSLHSCFNLRKSFLQYLSLKKVMISRESTRKSVCMDYNSQTCLEIKGNQEIMNKFKCKVMFLDTGDHLDQYIEGYADLPICTNTSVLIEAIDTFQHIMENDEECSKSVSCQRTKFDINSAEFGGDYARSYFWLKYQDLEVEHFVTYISYDAQNLICELGGVLGMFLGLSGVSVGYFCVDWTERNLYDNVESPSTTCCNKLMRNFGRLKRSSIKNSKKGKTVWLIITAFAIGLLALIVILAALWPTSNIEIHQPTTMPPTTTELYTTTLSSGRTCYTGYEDKASNIFALNGHCYYVENDLKDFDSAIANCKALFGLEAYLAEPHNLDENNDMYDWAIDYVTTASSFWIGINDRQSEGVWTFQTSGLEIPFQNWNENEPNNVNNEDCVQVHKQGMWNDNQCSSQLCSICQYNTTSPPPVTLKPGSEDPGLENCAQPAWVGDGFCDDQTNIPECQMDGGDCCLPQPNTEYCSVCQCYNNGTTTNEACEGQGGVSVWVGDGYCDDGNNIADCDFDGGDCCLDQILTDYCDECECLDGGGEDQETPTVSGCSNPSWVGDGWCDDETNVPECNYDNGDCCLENVFTDYCNECVCIEN